MEGDREKGTESNVKLIAEMATPGGTEFAVAKKNKAPVFVLGCPRSGTTVLYHMLLSAGGFAVYRAESNVFNLLVPRFRGMRSGGGPAGASRNVVEKQAVSSFRIGRS